MTYCVALRLDSGLVFAADTRTNAGVDNIAQYRKLHFWRQPGDRVLVLLSAGNLAVTQSVVSNLNEQLAAPENSGPTLFTVPSMYRAARLVGDAVRDVRRQDGAALEMSKAGFSASFILGGQIGTERPRLFQIYSEGNFIEATDDTPFLQIGEHKYGKPILDRVTSRQTTLIEGVALTLISMDSTIRSNLSVALPLDLAVIRLDQLRICTRRRITEDDPYYRTIRDGWSDALRDAYLALPRPDFVLN